MKYISRITALLLALMMLTPTFASALTLDTATQSDLDKLYEAANSVPEYWTAGLLGDWTGISTFGNLANKDLYTFQWYDEAGNPLDSFEEPTVLRVANTMEEQKFYCVATDATGNQLTSPMIVLSAADISNAEDYLALLYEERFLDVFGSVNTLTVYRLMTETWNVTMADGSNLAEKVLALWWAEREESYFDPYLLCSCVITGAVESEECVLHPNSAHHAENCSWKQEEITANVDVSTPDSLLDVTSVTLAAVAHENVQYYGWENYVFDASNVGMRWEVVDYILDTNLYEIPVNKDSIQTAYRVVTSTTEGDVFDSKPFYLGGYDFYNWIHTNEEIQAWMADTSVTLADVVARYNEKDCINADDYTYEGENGQSVNLKVPEGAFTEEYVMEVEPVAADEAAQLQNTVLQSMDATGTHTAQLLMALDISFANLNNRAEKLQPAEGTSVALTFEVDTTGINEALKYLYVYHIANDGTPEVVAGPIDAAFGKQTITVQAEGFSTYLVMATTDECVYCQNHEYCFYDTLLIDYVTPTEQYDHLQSLEADVFDGYLDDYVRHIEAGAPTILCTCVDDYTVIMQDELKSPEEEHSVSCPWNDGTTYLVGLLGFVTDLAVKVDGTYEWYLDNEDGTRTKLGNQSNTCEAAYEKVAKLYICEVTANGGTTEYRYYVQADMTDVYQYLAHLEGLWAGDDRDRHAIYELMTTTWNVQLDETAGNTLAKSILVYWKYNYIGDDYFWDVLCSCCIDETGVVSDQILLHPDSAHYEECPWWNGDTLVDPDQPPLYEGKPEGNQYTETLKYTLPMDDDRAVILQTGARAILTSEKTTPGVWQVYTGEEWVDIQGETSNVIEVTEAKLNSIFERTGIAKLRYFDAVNNEVLETAQVTTQQIADGNYPGDFEFMVQTRALEVNEHETTDEICNLVINYVFADGKTAAPSWTSTGANGAPFVHDPVKSPAVTGYAPDAAEVVVARDNLTAHITWTVIYRPAEVAHTVEHYFQKLGEVGYAETPVVTTHTGYTGSEVGKGLELPADERTGFYALPYESTVKIAADGSTVTEIYYDRYYYLMAFDMNGGFGVESIYAQYGTAITAQTPTRYGYVFTGWKNVDTGVVYQVNAFEHANMPADNTEYEAQWSGEETTFDVVFWYENADDDGYSQAGTLLDQTGIAGTTVQGASYQNSSFTGRDSTHFTFNAAKTDKDVVLKGDGSTVVNVYFTRNVYTLTFVMGSWADDCDVAEHRHDDDCKELVCTLTPHDHATAGCELSCDYTHTHDLSCYSGAYGGDLVSATPSVTLTHQGDGIYTGTVRYNQNYSYTVYYVKIGNEYYRNEYGEHIEISLNCTNTHTHTDSCYTCGQTAHTHGDSCYELICGKYEHYHSGDTCYLVVTAKYDADITAVWLNDPVKSCLDEGYVFKSSVTSMYYSFLEKMAGQNITMTATSWSGNTYRWYYYLEVLPGMDTTNLTLRTDNGVTYYLYDDTTVKGSGLSLTYEEDYYPITGFTQRDKTVPSFSNYTAYLYYRRNSYDLTFSNYGTTVADKGGTFLYEQDISGQYFVPAYPSTLPAGAYEFAGWYTSPFFAPESKFEFTTTDADGNTVNTTMPANDVTLYAYWKEIEFDVTVYDHPDLQGQLSDQDVAFNHTAVEVQKPTNGDYIFVGWFYMENEVEKAFDFSMPITKDMVIYAKWSSNVLKQYTIKYAVENADGSLTYIADDTVGYALAGNTKTFDAKAGTELDAGYQTGYYPVTNSHSLTLSIDDETKNTFTFIYVQAPAQPYTVYYLAKEPPSENAEKVTVTVGGKEEDGYIIHTTKNEYTTDAVHTETFVPVTGYRPDAYQKSLVVSTTAADNVIVFWYEVDNVHAPVQVIHYIQNEEGEDYRVYQSSTDLNAIIGNPYSTNVLNMTGFKFDHATAGTVAEDSVPVPVTPDANNKVTATVSKDGLLLELYYDRIEYPYEFRFVEQGNTSNVLHDPIGGNARYGAQVTQTAVTIPGYTCVDPESKAHAITIKTEDGDTAVKNVKTFYYSEDTVNIKYIAVFRDENGNLHVEDATGGTVKLTDTTDVGASSTQEKTAVKVVTGNPNGATAERTEEKYKFVGWYSDEDCTTPVTADGWVEGNVIDPQKIDGLYQAGIYYALFEYNLTSLTITKVAGDNTTFANDEVFIFTVKGDGLPNDGMKVVIKGAGSVTIDGLTVGQTYTVTEDTGWSWRYTCTCSETGGKIKLVPENPATDAPENQIVFTNTLKKKQWIDGNTYAENTFTAVQ